VSSKLFADPGLTIEPMKIDRITRRSFDQAIEFLRDVDPNLGKVLSRLGPPPMWDREPGFPTLVHIILEQQVSLASAKAAFDKLSDTIAPLEPAAFLTLDDATLKSIGFSGQKGRYCRELAHAIIDGTLDLDVLPSLPDRGVRAELEQVTGIGPWTADIYLLMALLRPDVWPPGDLALAAAVQDLKGLDHRPESEELQEIAERWRPWRSAAARILWHHYLNPEL
jgi:DNA-3-methyladenine glycosylase II